MLCRAHPPIRYDLLSIDIGSTPRSDDVPGAAEHTIAVKPIDHFAARWEALLARAREDAAAAPRRGRRRRRRGRARALGAASARRTARRRGRGNPGHPRGAAAVAQRAGSAGCSSGSSPSAGSTVLTDSAVVRVEPGALICADGRRIEFDEALWVTEAGAAPWLAETGLPLTAGGLHRDRRKAALDRRPERSSPPATSRRCSPIRARRRVSTRSGRARRSPPICAARSPASGCGAPCRSGARWR